MEEFRTLVLYRSKHGSTKRYAQWIADELDADIISAENKNFNEWSAQMKAYDMIIYGGNINGRGINGIENFQAARKKGHITIPVAYFCVGSYPAYESTVQTHLEMNFSGENLDDVHLFYFRGRLDYLGLGFLEKRMMGGLFKAIEKKYPEDRTDVENELLEAYYDDVDWSSRDYIVPLVNYVKSFMTEEQLADLAPRAQARIEKRAVEEAEEAEAWDAEMKRREELHQKNLEADEEYKLKRMSKKRRQKYLEQKQAQAALEQSEEDQRLLAGEDLPSDELGEALSAEEDEYAEFRDLD